MQAGLEDSEEGLEYAEVDHLLRHVSVLEYGEHMGVNTTVEKGILWYVIFLLC